MIELTQEEIEALGLPAETTPENAYNQYGVNINSAILQFSGATGWALNSDGSIQSVTPDTITLESAKALYDSYPRFNGRPYADEASLNRATALLIKDRFIAHFSNTHSNYQDIFDKVITLVISGELQAEWAEWLEIRKQILADKDAYKLTTPWGSNG